MPDIISGVVAVHAPQGRPAPAVFDSPHSGFDLPADWGALPSRKHLWPYGGVDNHVHELFRDGPRHGAPLIEALFPRSYIDPNRNEDEVDPDLLDGTWPKPLKASERVGMGSGLIWRKVFPDVALYDRKLTVAEVEHRIEHYWRPYQRALRRALDEAHARFGQVFHFNCHSNRTRAPRLSADGEGTLRPEMELGTLDGRTSGPEFVAAVRDALRAMGYQVVVDGFHKGQHLIRHYADPKVGRHSIMIEIRKDLYMDDATGEKNARFAETQANMGKLAQAICDFARERTGA